MTFEEMRADYIARRKGALGLPVTGIINYSVAALLSLWAPVAYHNVILAICFWAIMPVGALVGHLRKEQMIGNPDDPLFRLAAQARLMVLATWAIHIPVWVFAPSLFPLTVCVAFSLHWMIFAWSLGQPSLRLHTLLRVTLVPLAWYFVPENRMGAAALVTALTYVVSVWQLSRIEWEQRSGEKLSDLPSELFP